ncbi:MAG: DUF6249 domain-containing protein [Steroidobacteraceae bacterium]
MHFLHIFGVSVPVVAIVLGIGCAMFSMYLDYRKKRELLQLHHAERMAAIEKGIELPPLPEEYFSSRRGRSYSTHAKGRRTGLILLFLGIAITLGLWGGAGPGDTTFWWGLVLVGLGLAFLLAAALDARELRQSSGPQRPNIVSGSGSDPK